MSILLSNALLVELDPAKVESGAIRIDGGLITERGPSLAARPGDVTVDCGGCIVMPGLVNGHTHLYSALAAGVPMPKEPMRNFHEILKFLWWRLDRALDAESIHLSALIGSLDAARCGTTTLIDHHASPSLIEGSLDLMERGLRDVGLRGVFCYETTDRNGKQGRNEGLSENARYIAKCKAAAHGEFAALVGAHASFTCGNGTMEKLADLAKTTSTGVHIHVAEDPVDQVFCDKDHKTTLVDRLDKYGMLGPDAIFAHCTHLDERSFARLAEAGVNVGHNTRSNMNNSVGYTKVGLIKSPILLGTDGIGANMFSEAQTAWFKACDAKAGFAPSDVTRMLGNNARRASRALGVRLGELNPGAAADIIVTDYLPATPLSSANIAGHFIFAMGSQHVRHVMARGHWVLRDRVIQLVDEAKSRRAAVPAAKRLWEKMATLD
jgi:putative selenium metabolism protein SsnA